MHKTIVKTISVISMIAFPAALYWNVVLSGPLWLILVVIVGLMLPIITK